MRNKGFVFRPQTASSVLQRLPHMPSQNICFHENIYFSCIFRDILVTKPTSIVGNRESHCSKSFPIRVNCPCPEQGRNMNSQFSSAIFAQTLSTELETTWKSWPNNSHLSCEWVDCDLEVLWVELKRNCTWKLDVRISALFTTELKHTNIKRTAKSKLQI